LYSLKRPFQTLTLFLPLWRPWRKFGICVKKWSQERLDLGVCKSKEDTSVSDWVCPQVNFVLVFMRDSESETFI
jgi:hypothetical protein